MEQKGTRIGWIDELRGLAVWAMILYHIAFNLVYFLEVPLPWLKVVMESRGLHILHVLFVAIFLGLSGICSHFTRHPWHRVGKVAIGAAAVTVVTWILFLEEAIWFGVLHCLAVCMALEIIFGRHLKKIPPKWGTAVSLILFALTYRLPNGYILGLELPKELYAGGLLTMVGLPDMFYNSLDYVPLLPHIFLFVTGVFLGNMHLPHGRVHMKALAFCGRHSLALYLLHQPVVFGLFFLLDRIILA